MKIMQVSLQGSSHRMFQVPNQDALSVSCKDDIVSAAVCDGVSLNSAGTWSSSEIAAQFCAQTFVAETEGKTPSSKELVDGFQQAASGLLQELREQGIPWMDCQCTMLGIMMTPAILQAGLAGDGGIICEDASGQIRVLVTKPKTGSVVDPVILAKAWRFAQIDSPRKVLILTDGLFDQLVFLEDGALAADLNLVSRWLNASQEQLEKLAQETPGHDDKTAVLIRVEETQQTVVDAGALQFSEE